MYIPFIVIIAVCASVHDAHAQSTFPSRAVRIISGFAPGGATDVAARAVSQRMTESLGQPVVVENRPGAAGIIAAELVARSTPDGHMLYLANATLGAPTLFAKLPFDITRDFAFVSLIGSLANRVGAPSVALARYSICPSGVERATSSAAIMPAAPGRFSTTTG